MTEDVSPQLLDAIRRANYYPHVIEASLRTLQAGEPVTGFFLQHAPTFDPDGVGSHMTVLALTPNRLLICHTDEYAPDHRLAEPYTSTATEAVPLGRLSTMVVNQVVPETSDGKVVPAEVWLTLGWGSANRIELEPAICADPACEADHGYSGTMAGEDFVIRCSSQVDGAEAVSALLEFAQKLSRQRLPHE